MNQIESDEIELYRINYENGPLDALASLLLLFSGSMVPSCSPDREVLPGVYDLTSNGQLAISVTGHAHAWWRAGILDHSRLVVENEQNSTTSVDPASFKVMDSLGGTAQGINRVPLSWKSSRTSRNRTGGVVVGSLEFKLRREPGRLMLYQGSGIERSALIKLTSLLEISYSPGFLLQWGTVSWNEGISRWRWEDDSYRLPLKNLRPGVMLLGAQGLW